MIGFILRRLLYTIVVMLIASIVFIFKYRSFKEVIASGRADRATSRSPREPPAPE